MKSLRTNRAVLKLSAEQEKTERSHENLTATASRELGSVLGFWGAGGSQANKKTPQPTDVSRLSVSLRHHHKICTQRRACWSAGGLARKKTTRWVTAEALHSEAVSARRWQRASCSASPASSKPRQSAQAGGERFHVDSKAGRAAFLQARSADGLAQPEAGCIMLP